MTPARWVRSAILLVCCSCGDGAGRTTISKGGEGEARDTGGAPMAGGDSGVPGDSGPAPEDDTAEPVWVDEDGDGYSPTDGDCADDDPTVHPGAEDEPLDGVDNDCGGPDRLDLDGGGFTFLYSCGLESAYYAESSVLLDDLWGDGLAEVILMDDDNEDPWSTPWWHVYFFDSQTVASHPEVLMPTDARLELSDIEAEYGFETYSVGDVDGDLLPDIVTADRYYRHGAYLFRGSSLSTLEGVVDVDEVKDVQMIPSGTPGVPCYDVASGFLSDPLRESADIAMMFLDEAEEDMFVSVVQMREVEDGLHYLDGLGDTTIYAAPTDDVLVRLSGIASVGDLDGDGLDELEVDFWSPYPSRTYAIFPGGSLSAGAAVYASEAGVRVETDGVGIEEYSYGLVHGVIISQVGDINGDGFGDLLMGVPYRIGESGEDSSSAWIWSGPRVMEGGSKHITGGDVEIESDHIAQALGKRATLLGDLDHDGREDLMLHSSKGALEDSEASNSVALIFMGSDLTFGSTISALSASYMLARDGGEDVYSAYTGSMSGGKDVDGDGIGDMILSIATYSDDNESRAYFIPGWEP